MFVEGSISATPIIYIWNIIAIMPAFLEILLWEISPSAITSNSSEAYAITKGVILHSHLGYVITNSNKALIHGPKSKSL